LGILDLPAWVVVQANQYASDHNKTPLPFVVYRGMERREIIPMVRVGAGCSPTRRETGGKLFVKIGRGTT
ncbi:hypothetical protein F5146DRAFT_936926, partial [Armillaria mellea]